MAVWGKKPQATSAREAEIVEHWQERHMGQAGLRLSKAVATFRRSRAQAILDLREVQDARAAFVELAREVGLDLRIRPEGEDMAIPSETDLEDQPTQNAEFKRRMREDEESAP